MNFEGTFIGLYKEYMQSLETSEDFDLWAASWCISTILGRDILVDRPRIPVHMNQYIIFAGQAGTVRKSTAVNVANKVVAAYAEKNPDRRILEVTAKTTPEMFEWKMSQQSLEHGTTQVAISVSELVRFLGREKYLSAMPGLLTDLYDCPSQQKSPGTFSRGEFTLNKVYLTFLAASTPSWLVRAMNPDVVEGGFTSRVLFVLAEAPKTQIAWPQEAKHTIEDLVHKLACLYNESKNAKHRITLSDSAIDAFSQWYVGRQREFDEFRASFQGREDEHILRLAGILAANDNSWVITPAHISFAVREVIRCKENGAKLFEHHLTYDRLALGVDRLRKTLEDRGRDGIAQAELYRRVRQYFNKERFDSLLAGLHQLGMVDKSELRPPGGIGRPATYWQATPRLRSPTLYEDIAKIIQPEALLQ